MQKKRWNGWVSERMNKQVSEWQSEQAKESQWTKESERKSNKEKETEKPSRTTGKMETKKKRMTKI